MKVISFAYACAERLFADKIVRPGLWVKADSEYRHSFISTKHPPLTPFMKPRDILYS